MFFTKKKKIQKYLEQKAESDKNAFDFLLCNYLDGTLKTDLELLGITKNEIHIDWLDDIKCIGIQGRYNKIYPSLKSRRLLPPLTREPPKLISFVSGNPAAVPLPLGGRLWKATANGKTPPKKFLGGVRAFSAKDA